MNVSKCLVSLLCIVGFSSVSCAALIDQGITTLDTATGLVWLDVTRSFSRPYNDVTANFAPGGDFYGYRYATQAEMLQFWNNAGFTDTSINDPAYPPAAAGVAIRNLQLLIGIPQPNNGSLLGDATFAINGDAYSPTARRSSVLTSSQSASGISGMARADWGGASDSAASGNFGSYLVQVPEPSLIGGLVLAAGFLMRRPNTK